MKIHQLTLRTQLMVIFFLFFYSILIRFLLFLQRKENKEFTIGRTSETKKGNFITQMRLRLPGNIEIM